MKTIINALEKIQVKSMKGAIVAIASIISLLAGQIYAANTPQFNQSISDGSKSVDIVDSGGSSVGSPTVSFSAATFSFSTQDTTGTLGAANAKIRVSNPTATATWTVNLAASGTTDLWTDAGNTYDFNDGSGYTDGADTDSKGGQMTIDPSGGTVTGVSGCSTSNVNKGASDSFVEGSTDSIDLVSGASGAATFCRWDYTGAALTQKVPAGQASGSYALSMTLTII